AALRVGESIDDSPALSAVHTYIGHTSPTPAIAFAARPTLVSIIDTLAAMSSFRRSTASASAPPKNEHAITGPSCARLSRPTCSDDPVSWKIWICVAT